jgi:hypothetical protein
MTCGTVRAEASRNGSYLGIPPFVAHVRFCATAVLCANVTLLQWGYHHFLYLLRNGSARSPFQLRDTATMLPLEDDCDECVPEYARRRPMTTIVSSLPFLLTFLFVAVAVSQKLFPLLSGHERKAHHESTHLPGVAARAKSSLSKNLRPSTRSLASIIFSTNIALSAVLAELIFCEIANTVNPATRNLGLKLTLPLLLFLLIIVTPAFEIHSVISKTGLNANGGQKGQRRIAWVLEFCGFAAWLGGFWWLGRGLLGSYLHEETYIHEHTFSEGCLERIGIIGISLMASLAGFAAISSLWQTFGVKYRPVGTPVNDTT